ncbi:MAG: O-antigen ligase family protein [Candidatus Marinimicrobia bacterium]|jgi:O-antigen ligase|nr:O-antigen ligase family protein [Candidatus Neomarinimicrobiota bacterium]MBT5268500.1 O-antigen ligase family protein [Candidatus Neomarinimicrobiota bacterium]
MVTKGSEEKGASWYARQLMGTLVLLMLALSVAVHKASGMAALAMLVVSLVGLFLNRKKSSPQLELWEKWWLGVTLLFFGLIALDVLMGYGDVSVLDSPSRLILAIPVYLYLRRTGFNLDYLLVGAGVGALLAGGYAGYQHLYLGREMAEGFTSHIYFGQIALILTLYALFSVAQSGGLLMKLFYGLAVIAGFYAVLASGSRGGWIAIPTIFILLMSYNVWHMSLRKRVASGMIFVAVLLAAYQAPELPVQNRVDAAVNNVVAYFEEGRVATSSGFRLEMWKAAWIMTVESDFLGVGEAEFDDHVKRLANEGRVHSGLSYFNAPHSQYFNALAEQGGIGLLSLLLLMFVPLKTFLKSMRVSSEQRDSALLGAVTVIGYMDFMLTAETLDRQLMVLLYAFVMAVLCAVFFQQNRPKAPAEGV